MAKRHGLRTEASARFERGLPVELPPLALSRAVEMLQDVAAGKLMSASDQLNEQPQKRSIELNVPRLSKLLGFGITHKEAVDALAKLQIEAGKGDLEDCIKVPEVPWWRTDLRLPEDLVEEVVRVVGYDKVPSTIPSWRPTRLAFDRTRAKRRLVRDVLYGAGLFEVMTYSFVSREQLEDLGHDTTAHLKLKNPLSSEQAYLRSSLLPSHLAVLARNRNYAKEVGFYEISNVFLKRGREDQPDEPVRLAVMLNRPAEALAHAKGILDELARALNLKLTVAPDREAVFAPGRAGRVMLGETAVGWIGQVHPERVLGLKVDGEVASLEVDLTPLIEAAGPVQFGGLERFPTIQRDLAVLVPVATTWSQVAAALEALRVEYVSDYYGNELPEGMKSLTLRLTVALPDRTPTEAEAADAEAKALRILERKLGAKPRE
jgi:phenylalanyl-tRNA synthetase beta chain